jgi:hypothetical protein
MGADIVQSVSGAKVRETGFVVRDWGYIHRIFTPDFSFVIISKHFYCYDNKAHIHLIVSSQYSKHRS